MENSEICRSHAITGMLLAEQAADPHYRLLLTSIARLWTAIGETSERLEALGICP